MYVGPFVAAWEKIVDIRLILREGAFMFWKKNRNTVINGNDPDRVLCIFCGCTCTDWLCG